MSYMVVWDKDTGKIMQGNKIYFPDEQYFASAKEIGQENVFKAHESKIFDPDNWYAPNAQMTERQTMNIMLDKNRIKCGENDAAIFRGLPRPVTWMLICLDMVVHTDKATKNVLEIRVPVPGLYKVKFDQWPYKICEFTFEAV